MRRTARSSCTAGGRDRTGVLSALILDAAGVEREAVLEDYALGIRIANDAMRVRPTSAGERAVPDAELEARLPGARTRMDEFLDSVIMRPELRRAVARAAARLR